MLVEPLLSKSKGRNDTSPPMFLLYLLSYRKPVIPLSKIHLPITIILIIKKGKKLN